MHPKFSRHFKRYKSGVVLKSAQCGILQLNKARFWKKNCWWN